MIGKLIVFLVFVVCFILWMHGLATWDGKGCDPDMEE